MDGAFLGGGAIEHVVSNGEIYLRSDQIARLLGETGIKLGLTAIQENDPDTASAAHLLMTISEQLYLLRSELLKREIEKSFEL